MRLIWIAWWCLMAIACEKQPIIVQEPSTPPDPPKLNFNLVWMTPISSDTVECISSKRCLVNGDLMIVKFFHGGDDVVQLLDGKTGQRNWTRSDPEEWADGSYIGSVDAYQGAGLICSWSDIHAYDGPSGTPLWHSDIGSSTTSGSPRMRVINDYIYHAHEPKGTNDASKHLVRASAQTGTTWDTLFTAYRIWNGGYSPSFEMPEPWVSSLGDTLLIFQNRQVNFGSSDGRIDLYAFNLRSRQVAWKVTDFVPEGNSSVQPPRVWRDRVFFQGVRSLYCFDAATGSLLWKKDYNGNLYPVFMGSRLHVFDDRLLIAQSDNGDIYAFDVNTGAQVWKTADSYTWDQEIGLYQGNIYAVGVDDYLHCINAVNGRLLWSALPPARALGLPSAGFSYGGVLINPDLGYLYVNDRHFWYCLKLL